MTMKPSTQSAMWTSTLIRKHIYSLPTNKIFTTRNMLIYGSRASVDQCMYRLVKDGEIERVARGVFIRPDYFKKLPTLAQLAKAKAKSFVRKIVGHGKEAARKLHLISDDEHSRTSLSNGSSSSFRSYAHGRYYAHATSPRKMDVGSGTVGKVIKALWYLGGEDMEMDIVEDAIAHLKDADWVKLYAVWHYMPHWMTDRILWLQSDRVQNWLFARKNPASQN